MGLSWVPGVKMSRWFSLVGALACGCVDYEFAPVVDRGGFEGEEDGFGPGLDGALGDDTDGRGDGGTFATDDSGGGDGVSTCETAGNLTEYLDTFQVTGDDRVLYCHGTGGGNFVLVESDISACFPHLDHRFDVFPATGCDS